MILFFSKDQQIIIAVKIKEALSDDNFKALKWLLGNAEELPSELLQGYFVGPRKEMVTPWSTTAVEITINMNIQGIERMEEFIRVDSPDAKHDKMLQRIYKDLDEEIFTISREPEKIKYITDIEEYNQREGLALNIEEIEYLKKLSDKLGRALTDSEVFGFSQVNSEHCRHKIFNGTFIIDGVEMPSTLFDLIKKTSKLNPNRIVSAYKDNCAFIEGPDIKLFHPQKGDKPDFFVLSKEETVISLKAETHNFPTTVEPFNGAATGSGGEIRDRMAGGRGSFPLAGTAVYMTSYPRFEVDGRYWECNEPHEWLYQTPEEILIKASNGASDFGNKFGQPLICGSVLTFEHSEFHIEYGYDKVIMLAGGVGFAKKEYSAKNKPETGDKIAILGGENYRIGMGGGAVSSVDTGEYDNSIELNAIQRSNPEMQKRVYNAIRALAESDDNSIISIHDHGAGGHLNCLSELVEDIGADIDLSKLPVGDSTLSAKEIIGNESQERMGLLIKPNDVEDLEKIASRERAPLYMVGETTGKKNFTFINSQTGEKPIDLQLEDMFGSAPKTVIEDRNFKIHWDPLEYDEQDIEYYLEMVLQLESVACKDWLTNKVDRSVTGLVANQQSAGEIQLPLNNLGVVALGYNNLEGIATSIGHAPAIALINAEAGSRMAISESLTNIVWTPIKGGLRGISLSANWMWPCKNPGEDARLYSAVNAASDFAIELGINIPTGKDSLSMTQKYPDGSKVLAPGTLIISAAGESSDIRRVVRPVLATRQDTRLFLVPFTIINETSFALGGSAFAQITGQLGNEVPDIDNADYFAECFNAVQEMIASDYVLAGHDISAGGMVTTLLEMCFANCSGGIKADLSSLNEKDPIKLLFAEISGVVVQVPEIHISKIEEIAQEHGIVIYEIGTVTNERSLQIKSHKLDISLEIDHYREIWYKTSYLLDVDQAGEQLAYKRYTNYSSQPLRFKFPEGFTGKRSSYKLPQVIDLSSRPTAAIIREKGSNGDREMAWALHLAGFAVKDVHMTDLISGREDLKNIRFIVFVGGFSNADTLGSAKGWAGAFLYNKKAKESIEEFYSRDDTLSLGICNGCQLMTELGFITPEDRNRSPKMLHNDSHKFESGFVGVSVEPSPSIMFSSLIGSELGIWVAHGEGKFSFPEPISNYSVALRYTYNEYPANPNGSPDRVAGICSNDGRHLAIMPHPERCIYPHNWAYYTRSRIEDEITPWIEMFVNAKKWILKY
jgi:phosphoribosylformylglycinamidine synthase